MQKPLISGLSSVFSYVFLDSKTIVSTWLEKTILISTCLLFTGIYPGSNFVSPVHGNMSTNIDELRMYTGTYL